VPSHITAVLKKELSKAKAEQQRWAKRVEALEGAISALRDEPSRTTIAKRRPMDAAERRAVSRRMKKYWARRRSQTL
jgi:hypothetical protein